MCPGERAVRVSSEVHFRVAPSGKLGYVTGNVYKLKRFKVSADLAVAPLPIHDVIDMVANPNVVEKPDLVQAGTSKLLAVWLDNRWGGMSELYAAPIDLKACP